MSRVDALLGVTRDFGSPEDVWALPYVEMKVITQRVL